MKKNVFILSVLLLFGVFSSTNVKAQCAGPVPNAPVASAPVPINACPGSTISLSATEVGTNILWYDVPSGGTPFTTVPSGTTITVNPMVNTVYYAESQTIPSASTTFNFTGGLQTFIVPPGVTSLFVQAWGAQGGSGALGGNSVGGGTGGLGGYAEGFLAVTPGDILNIFVGGQGATPAGGFNGGGIGGTANAGGGGGSSDIRVGGTAEANRVLTAGGGGGGGRGGCHEGSGTGGVGGAGGAGGGGIGQDGNDSPQSSGVAGGGKGGNFGSIQGAFGPAGVGCSGFLGNPGSTATTGSGATGGGGQSCCCSSSNSVVGGGGGGGGQLGGGGGGGGSAGTTGCAGNSKGAGGGGGGGSSFTGSLTSPVINNGIWLGNGQVTVSYSSPLAGCVSATRTAVPVTVSLQPPTLVTATPATICPGGNSNLNATSTTGNVRWYDAPTAGNLLATVPSASNFNVSPLSTTTYHAAELEVLAGTSTFNFNGSIQTFTVPAGVTSLFVQAWGAQGGSGALGGNSVGGGTGGLGGYAEGFLAVTPGDILNIFVGGQGATPAGGFNGGGNGGTANAGGGGGSSDIRVGGTAEANRVLTAGGGGGGGRGGCHEGSGTGGVGGAGGAGGGGIGQDGNDSPQSSGVAGGGKGGNFGSIQGAFGPAGVGCSGFLGNPGSTATTGSGATGGGGQSCCCSSSNSVVGGGGGGGGQLGGGGGGGGSAGTTGCAGNSKGAGGGGGGGSSFTGSLTSPVINNGIWLGNGQVTISWSTIGTCESARVPVTVSVNPIAVTASASPTSPCGNSVVTLSATSAAATGYTWMPGSLTNQTEYVQIAANTTYTVTATDGTCTSTSTVALTFNAPTANLAPATSNQVQYHADDKESTYFDASCNLIANIDDAVGGNELGLTTTTVNVEPTSLFHNGQPFVRRWYQITPANNIGVNALVKLYINQSDFDNYNTVVTAPYLFMPTSGNNADPNIANIRITKNADPGLGNSPVVVPTTVFWNGNFWELSFTATGFSQFRVHSANNGNVPLPVALNSFSGRKVEATNLLEWSTSTEQNSAYFNLQYSTDGANFNTLSKVNSKSNNGNSTELLSYEYAHTNPALGHNYYRLQQADLDGHLNLTSEVVDLMRSTSGSTLNVYPNPTSDLLNIDLYSTNPSSITLKLLDISGRKVKEIKVKTDAGMNKLILSMSDVIKGMYTLQVYEGKNLSFTQKVIRKD